MAEKYTYYPMDVDRFDESESVRNMSLDEVGLYVLCLNRSWKIGSLPDDVEAVALEVRRKVAAVRKAWPAVRSCYVPAEGKPGRLVNPTQEEKRSKVAEKAEKSRLAVEARWAKKYGRNTDVSVSNGHSDTDVHTPVDTDVLPRAFSFTSIPVSQKKSSFCVDSERLIREYPREIDDEDMRHFISYVLTESDHQLFFENLPAHAELWNHGFIPKLENFLRKGTWKVRPKSGGKPVRSVRTAAIESIDWENLRPDVKR